MNEPPLGALRHVPYMGVIYVVSEAMKLGFYNGHPDWCNLGQGQPEVGELEGAPRRIRNIQLQSNDYAYGPIGGTEELRKTVADHYNRLYRHGKSSKYTATNVSVASGGRLALTRLFAALGDVTVGYQIPDYTAYEDMMNCHLHRFIPNVIPACEENGFSIPPSVLEREVANRGIEAFVLSNPCNPTGCVIQGKELKQYLDVARKYAMTLVLDEFYSHFIYGTDGTPGNGPVSGAAFIEDVERDAILLVDGLTKSFRYPGWRIGWVVGPSSMIEILNRTASSIDGGPSMPMQRAAIQVLQPERADQETQALRQVFASKRNLMVSRLKELGIICASEPRGTFYCWASVKDLPEPLNDGGSFFRQGLKYRVMTVPGVFFDVNPGKRRRISTNFQAWVRFSFGPTEETVNKGLDRLEQMIQGC